MLQDKDVVQVLGTFGPLVSEFIAVQPDNPRAMDKFELCRLVQSLNTPCVVASDLTQAAKFALHQLDDASALVVFGSLYLASEIRPILKSLCDEL